MDRFPEDYYLHNLPLLLLSGLGSQTHDENDPSGRAHNFLKEGGFRITIESPVVQGQLAQQLQEAFREQDATNIPWHNQSLAPSNGRVFKISSVGRVYTLPPRKAPPPPRSPRLSAAVANGNPPPLLVLHSPLSPLTPISPLYPDGITSPLWVLKHQSRLPCAFLSFFTLVSDPRTSSLEDNKLKADINSLRSIFASTNYKTRLVVILVADGNISSPDLEDRFSTIRRSTGLDGKSIHALPFTTSPAETRDFVASLLSSLYPSCVEYYRDLSKHARRKRNRNTVPQPTVQPGSAHLLSLPAWNVRYEFKLGVFAEFRQEMDAACRNYETAYESLFSAEIMDAIAVWSPRFNEARMLADVIALRTIRCLLWTDQGVVAVRSWVAHRERMTDLVDRRSKGTDNYGWEAWQSMWATVMADLISRSRYPLLYTRISESTDLLPIFAGSEKSLPATERLNPWDLVHHEGYWLEIARKATHARRTWARQIPEEDRQPPGRSPAGLIASKAQSYDTYLALEPYREIPIDGQTGYDYQGEIMKALNSAMGHFAKRGQVRRTELLTLQKALEYADAQSWEQAIDVLQPIWYSKAWRQAGWWKILQYIGWTMLDCLTHARNSELSIRLLWELSANVFERKAGANYALGVTIDDSSLDDEVISVAIDMDETLSPLVAAFAFSTHDVFVGEPLICQLSIESRAHAGMPPVTLTGAKVVFEGNLKSVYLVSQQADEHDIVPPGAQIVSISLQDSSSISATTSKRSSASHVSSETGFTDLTIYPGQTRVIQFQVTPREAGEISIASIALMIDKSNLRLAATTSSFDHSIAGWWETKGGIPVLRPLGQESNAYNTIEVQPKPPKLQIHAPNLRKAYYTNEVVTVEFKILNEEAEDAIVSVDARMVSPISGGARMEWASQTQDDAALHVSENGVTSLPPKDLGIISSADSKVISLRITDTLAAVDHEIEVIARYRLATEPETILVKSLTVDVGIVRPFEANYDFLPRLDQEPWPSFFDAPPPDADSSTALGLKHQYSVTANLYSFATESLNIEAILLTASKIVGGAVCSATTGILTTENDAGKSTGNDTISSTIQPDQTQRFDFSLAVQKLVLGDRNTVGVDLALEIGWRRQDSDEVNTTVLEVPRLVAAMAEPRVLLAIRPVSLEKVRVYRLDFMLENPSMHFLTFNLSMDTSEDYAFSGPKVSAISLVPISRSIVTYRIMPNKQDEWIGVRLNVIDAYFGQTLKILPGGEGVKVDKKGNVLIKV